MKKKFEETVKENEISTDLELLEKGYLRIAIGGKRPMFKHISKCNKQELIGMHLKSQYKFYASKKREDILFTIFDIIEEEMEKRKIKIPKLKEDQEQVFTTRKIQLERNWNMASDNEKIEFAKKVSEWVQKQHA